MKNNKRVIATLLCFAMLLLTVGQAMAVTMPTETEIDATITAVDNSASDALMDSLLRTGVMLDRETGDIIETSDDEIVSVIVILEGEPLLSSGNVDLNSQKALNALDALRSEQESVKRRISDELFSGEEIEIRYAYSAVLNGFAIEMPYGMIEKLNQIDGVKHAYASARYEIASIPEDQKYDIYDNNDPSSITKGEENHSEYKGEGMVIAILDTGIQTNHPMFTGGVTDARITQDDIAYAFQNLPMQAKLIMPSLSVSQAYLREKIPFQFDYANCDANASWGYSDHGVHVAGIAAGNDGVNNQCHPVAPEAQLVVMKVFRDDGYAYDADMYAAIEDCALLGVDCLNMSLGADCGFTSAYSYQDFDIALQNCANAGVGLAVAAGNSYSFSTSNEFSSNTLAMNPDNSIVSSPATFLQALCVASDTGGNNASMSDFTSWGAAPDLVLKPEISSYGDNVYSAVDGSSYGTKSGTSMATPHVAGGMAVIKQYLMTEYAEQYTQFELQRLVNTLIINTAIPNTDNNNIPYSPRRQGAGHMSIENAVSTPAYITVDGSDRPVIDQYDDVEENGVYYLEFTVHNMTDNPLNYTIEVDTLTERAGSITGPDGQRTYIMTETPYELNPIINTDFRNNLLTVPANSEVDVCIELILSRADINYIKEHYINGGYVEGFVRLITSDDEAVDLTVPFLCFFGDWTRAAAIDRGYYYDVINGDPNWMSQWLNGAYVENNGSRAYLGDNPYHSGVTYFADRNAISPNGDNKLDELSAIEMSLLRNVAMFSYTIADDDDVHYCYELPYTRKTFYYSTGWFGYMLHIGYDANTSMTPWSGTDANGVSLPNDTTVTVRMDAVVDYDLHEINNESGYWEFPLTIDTQAPEVVDIRATMANGTTYLYVTVRDNHYIADISFTNAAYSGTMDRYAIAETERGLETTYCYEIAGYGDQFGLVVSDYAMNRTTYAVNVPENMEDQNITDDNTIYFEDFEDAVPPHGWAIESEIEGQNPNYMWQAGSTSTSTAHIESAPDGTARDEWLITEFVDLSHYSTEARMVFEFETDYAQICGNDDIEFMVLVSNDGDNWTLMYSIHNEAEFASGSPFEACTLIPYSYQNENVCFAFVYQGHGGPDFDLDNIVIYDTGYEIVPLPGEDVGDASTASNINEALNVEGGTLEFENDIARPWVVDNASDRSSAKSNIRGSSNTTTTLTLDAGMLEAGYILSFDWYVSSESSYDWGRFYINGNKVLERCGDVGWETYSYIVPEADEYEFSWTYSKDVSVDSGDDCVKVDNVSLISPTPVTDVILTPESASLEMGSYLQLEASVLPENATIKTVTYSSSDESIATVDENGLVAAITPGNVEIIATSVNGVTAVCNVTVTDMPAIPVGYAMIILSASDVWNNGTGYQLLMDADADTFGSVIPTAGPLSIDGDADYSMFEYTIPVYADGTTTGNVVYNSMAYIYVPVGEYDIAITNPLPNDKIWIVDEDGRYNNFAVEEGYRYMFTIEAITTSSAVVGDSAVCESTYVGTSEDVTPPPSNPPTTEPPTTEPPTTEPPTTEPPTTEPPIEYELGDVNMDTLVNTGDAALVLRYAVELAELTPEQLALADINLDDLVNTGDAAGILGYAIGIYSNLPLLAQ